MTNKIYAIFDTESDTFVSYNSKCAWSKAGNAKNAFALHHRPRGKFDDQGRYKIVELSEMYFRLKDLEK